MSDKLDVEILELLASKICHDLISPIGAVNNGVEILEEMGAEAGADVTELIAYSAASASAKLQAYRLAYGAGGADRNLKPEDVYEAIEAVIRQDQKISQDWDPHGPLGFEEYPKGYCKMLAATLLLALEALPRGGTVTVSAAENATRIEARGERAAPKERTQEALSLSEDPDIRQPKHVHPYICALLARHYDFGLEIEAIEDDAVAYLLKSHCS